MACSGTRARVVMLTASSFTLGLWAMPPAVPAARGRFVSVHATLGRCSLHVLEVAPQDLRGCDDQKYFALFQRQSELDQHISHPDDGSARHLAEVQSFTPPEPLTGHVDAFFRKPPNRGVGSIRLVVVHPQGGVGGHSSSSVTGTPRAFARRSSTA